MFLYPKWIGLETYLEPSQTSKVDFFAKIVNDLTALNIFAETCILNGVPLPLGKIYLGPSLNLVNP